MKEFQRYLEAVAQANGLRAPLSWLFYPGMLQESQAMWWADFGTRATCHEGIDICLYRNDHGPITPLAPGARVPAMADGTVLNISGDLLGSSLVVSLPGQATPGQQTVLVYSHLAVAQALKPGDRLTRGSIIGQTFDTRIKKSRLLSHLHLSCICVPESTDPPALNWTLFADRERVFHINPVFL